MVGIRNALVDVLPSGEINELLKIASAGPNWTAARKKAFDRLNRLLEEINSVFFNGHCETYGLQTKGSSAVFRVPVGQRGNLSRFRGQLVLVICVDYDALWPQFSGRQFAAVPINAAGELITSNLDARKDKVE